MRRGRTTTTMTTTTTAATTTTTVAAQSRQRHTFDRGSAAGGTEARLGEKESCARVNSYYVQTYHHPDRSSLPIADRNPGGPPRHEQSRADRTDRPPIRSFHPSPLAPAPRRLPHLRQHQLILLLDLGVVLVDVGAGLDPADDLGRVAGDDGVFFDVLEKRLVSMAVVREEGGGYERERDAREGDFFSPS